MRDRRRTTVRLRITAVAVATLLVVLAITAFAIVQVQRRLLIDNLEESMVSSADAVSARLAEGRLPEILGGFGDDDDGVQLVVNGAVVASTDNLAGEPPIIDSTDGEATWRTVDGLPYDDGSFRILRRPVETPDGPGVLLLAATLEDIEESAEALQRALLVAIPLVALVLAGLTWWVVGRTLRPVEEAIRRQQRFVADASHELRSPLTRIRSELEAGSVDTASVLEDAVAMQRLLDDLLYLARADASSAGWRSVPVDLDDVVLREVQRARAEATVSVDTTGVSAAQVRGDAPGLARVVGNLLDNATAHAAAIVTVTLAERDSTAVLTVADDGPGIPITERERVFERFARLDDARTAGAGGTGLGLAIARDIVERHGGTIVVDSTTGDAGARFVVTLPLEA